MSAHHASLSPSAWVLRFSTLVVDGGASPAWMHHAALALADIDEAGLTQTAQSLEKKSALVCRY